MRKSIVSHSPSELARRKCSAQEQRELGPSAAANLRGTCSLPCDAHAHERVWSLERGAGNSPSGSLKGRERARFSTAPMALSRACATARSDDLISRASARPPVVLALLARVAHPRASAAALEAQSQQGPARRHSSGRKAMGAPGPRRITAPPCSPARHRKTL